MVIEAKPVARYALPWFLMLAWPLLLMLVLVLITTLSYFHITLLINIAGIWWISLAIVILYENRTVRE